MIWVALIRHYFPSGFGVLRQKGGALWNDVSRAKYGEQGGGGGVVVFMRSERRLLCWGLEGN